jgi:membrane protein DedA with SNARE-associated domain/membrane-associated phospholipid phosphatase
MFVQQILSLVADHPYAAYLAIFLSATAESLAFVGLLWPGTVLMLGAGALVATGALSLPATLLIAMLGAVTGDSISYWLGRRYRDRLRVLWPFNRHPEMLSHGEAFFRRHGGKSIFWGRFVGPIRPVIPIVAGMLGMPATRFTLVNVLSAIGWAFAYIIPGFVFGTSLILAGSVSARLVVLIALFLGLLWVSVWLCRRLVLWLGRLTPKGEKVLIPILGIILFLGGGGFIGVSKVLVGKELLARADQSIYHFLQSIRTPWGDSIMVAITELGGGVVGSCVVAAVSLTLVLRRRFNSTTYWLSTVAAGIGLVQFLKWAFHEPRPSAIQGALSGWGFPSSHSAMSAIIYGFLAILVIRRFQSSWRWLPLGTAVLFSLLVGLSRLYLGAHWLSDVLGGLFFGWAWISLAGLFYLHSPSESDPPKAVCTVALLIFAAVGTWDVALRHDQERARYAPRRSILTMAMQTWLAAGWRTLPAMRVDLGGGNDEPLTLQLAGTPEQLVIQLMEKGWRKPPSLDLKSFLGMFAPNPEIASLPVFPHLHDGRPETVLLVRGDKTKRWVVRLWPADIELDPNSTPLWIGTVEIQTPRPMAALLTLPKAEPDYSDPLTALEQSLGQELTLRRVYRIGTGAPTRFHWNGEVLLAAEAPAR